MVTRAASLRRGLVGWTQEGRRILASQRANPRLRCKICGRPNLTSRGNRRARPYCAGKCYEDDFTPAPTFKVAACGITRIVYDRAARGLVSVPHQGETYEEWKRSWEERAVVGCNDEFYNRYYRAWHITRRLVRRRDKACARCGSTGAFEYDHIAEVSKGGDALDPANVQRLCIRCHRRKTAAFLARGKTASAPNFRGPVRPLETFVGLEAV